MNLFFAKNLLINRSVLNFNRSLVSAESLSAEKLQKLNWDKRLKLLNFCYKHIPYYNRVFKENNIHPLDVRSEDDFSRIPILEKEDVRTYANELVAPGYDLDSLPSATTGGTTGEPLKTFQDPHVHLSSMSWRMLRWWGLLPSDNSGYLYRAVPDGIKKIMSDIYLWPTRRAYLSALDMTEDSMGQFHKKLNKIKAKYIVGYVGSIDIFADFMEKYDLTLPSLKAVWTTAAPLLPSKKSFYEKVFGCEIFSQYGSCEFYWVASDCLAHAGMHVASDIRHVEIVEGNAPVNIGVTGDVLVTDLVNYAFPLIRYRIGDRSRYLSKKCSCGLPFPLIDYVKGRTVDYIDLINGSKVPGEFWTTIFDDFTDAIKTFRIEQERDYTINIIYVPRDGDASVVIRDVEKRLRKTVPSLQRIIFTSTSSLYDEAGKKAKFITNERSHSI